MESNVRRVWITVIKWVAVPAVVAAVGFFLVGPRIGRPDSSAESSGPAVRTPTPSDVVEMAFETDDRPAPPRIIVSVQPSDRLDSEPIEEIPGPDDPVPPPLVFMDDDGDEASIGGIGSDPPDADDSDDDASGDDNGDDGDDGDGDQGN
ncbi:MAG: hypothetical protein IH944_06855 [Armatimonadetes bacterium]|nr:hypothetical protein [Armatimonadota bacterium]